jgi:ankyrin repeat protein
MKQTSTRFPLHVAARSADLAAIVALVEAGTSIELTDDEGDTPLIAALIALGGAERTSSALAIATLIGRGANVNAARTDGQTALMIAATADGAGAKAGLRGQFEDVVRHLLAAGADLHARDAAGNTALLHAASGGANSCGMILLDAGARADDVNHAGETVAGLAREAFAYDLLAALAARGGAVNVPTEVEREVEMLLVADEFDDAPSDIAEQLVELDGELPQESTLRARFDALHAKWVGKAKTKSKARGKAKAKSKS